MPAPSAPCSDEYCDLKPADKIEYKLSKAGVPCHSWTSLSAAAPVSSRTCLFCVKCLVLFCCLFVVCCVFGARFCFQALGLQNLQNHESKITPCLLINVSHSRLRE